MAIEISSYDTSFESLLEIAQDCNLRTFDELEKYTPISDQEDLPAWALRHIAIHKQLETVVQEAVLTGHLSKKTKCAISTLSQSKDLIRTLAQKVNYSSYLQAIIPKEPLATTLRGKPNNKCFREWEINFGLLYAAHERTEDKELKTTIRFLMVNYLAKAAFLNISAPFPISLIPENPHIPAQYEDMIQLGQLTFGGSYHREWAAQEAVIENILKGTLSLHPDRAPHYYPLETPEVQKLYKVGFVTTPDISHPEEIEEIIIQQFRAHRDQFPDTNYEFPILIDVTPQMGKLISADDSTYAEKREEVRKIINEIIKNAADNINAEFPETEESINNFLRANLAIVTKTQINDHLALLATPNIFKDEDFHLSTTTHFPQLERNIHLDLKIKEWMSHTGLTLGAIAFRQTLAERFEDPEVLALNSGLGRATTYEAKGNPAPLVFNRPTEYLETQNFRAFVDFACTDDPNKKGQLLLARATMEMIDTLLTRIQESDWRNPETQEISQIALLRLSQHIGMALLHADDFRQFSQAIDRVHAEMATLLTIFKPFHPEEFREKYKSYLAPIIPDSLQARTNVGLAKSAMNVFAGINAAIMQNNPNPVRICGPHSYYEEAALVGHSDTLDDTLQNPSIEKVDLYVTEFNHNIDVDPEHTHYQKGTVIEDIRRIFREKPKTDQLTVAIDGTIDFTRSQDLAHVLKTFETEIQEGRLNIVVFRSGQKFDMLGLDNYYGAPFFVVNNKDPKWDEFNMLHTDAAFQTDPLSTQYFSWLACSNPAIPDAYKQQIFDNARAILQTVPPSLMPTEQEHEICVSTFEEDVKTPFIEIKFHLEDEYEQYRIADEIQESFYHHFAKEGKLVYRRGSFGFAHPNFTVIGPKWRINPGLDPNENRIYQQFFQEMNGKLHRKAAVESKGSRRFSMGYHRFK